MLCHTESPLAMEADCGGRDGDAAFPSIRADRPIDLGEVLDSAGAAIDAIGGEVAAGLRRRLAELRQRLGEERLHVAIVGQFKRGKSTVLNALLGEALLPTAVVPVTAIPTYVQAGSSPQVVVSFRSDRQPAATFTAATAIDLQDPIHRFVAEDANRDNRFDVAAVQVSLPAPVLSKGIVLIDTPGIGSTLQHNTEATLGFLPQCDVALFVVSVDPPMTQVEAEFLATVSGHVPHLAFVLNKVDQIDAAERPTALRFLRDVLNRHAAVAADVRIFSVSARQALEARRNRNAALLAASGFDRLEAYLTEELPRQKSGLLRVAIVRKAAAVLSDALMTLELALRSLQLPLADLEERMASFERAVGDFERQRLTSKDLLAGERTRVEEALEVQAERLRQDASNHLTHVTDHSLAESPHGAHAQAALSSAVPTFFDQALRELSQEMSQRADVALRRQQESADALIDAVRAKAAQLFDIPYRSLEGETVLRSARNPYWVTHDTTGLLDSIAEGAWHRLLPESYRRANLRRALLARIEMLARRNVENVRWALRQNIDETFRRFGSELDDRLADTIAALHGAIRSAYAKRREQSPAIAAEVERLSALVRKLKAADAALAVVGRQASRG